MTIHTKHRCSYCTRAKRLLARKGVPIREVEISNDDALGEEMVGRAGGRTTVPQIFIGETHVGGCDDLYRLNAEGKIDALLG